MRILHTESCIISGCSYLSKGLLIELLRLEVEKPCLNSLQDDGPQARGWWWGEGPEKLVPKEETHLFEVHSLLSPAFPLPYLPASPPWQS